MIWLIAIPIKLNLRKKKQEKIYNIYCPLPRNNDYRLISNIDTHDGEILDNPGSLNNYVHFTISPEQQPIFINAIQQSTVILLLQKMRT
jgi:hypothetical protein